MFNITHAGDNSSSSSGGGDGGAAELAVGLEASVTVLWYSGGGCANVSTEYDNITLAAVELKSLFKSADVSSSSQLEKTKSSSWNVCSL